MGAYWLSISIGPVQGFIAAARRTRDLWYGSWLLSEISKAAALDLHEQGVRIVLPGVESAAELQPDSDLNVTNKILAHVPDPLDPAQVFASAERAAWARLRSEAGQVLGDIAVFINKGRWENQIDDFLEIYGAWVPDEGYDSRRAVEQLLNGRKALRDFGPGHGAALVPKSSLDAMRESVLRHRQPLSEDSLRRLDLRASEQLDAIGFIKRLGQGRRQYPSIGRIAADPWLRRLAKGEPEEQRTLADLKALAARLQDLPCLSAPQFAHFPFDSSICYPSRLADALPAPEHGELRKQIKGLVKRGPSPYMTVLIADGDHMGALIDSLQTMEEVQALSQELSRFAEKSKGIVAEHYGALVYAGGDDVLALLPLDQAVAAARRLHDVYSDILTPVAGGANPTLSVGIAVNHYLEPLTDILTRTRETGQFAKEPDRNGLAICLQKRAGGDALLVRYRWDDDPDERLAKWIALLESDDVPMGAAYELHMLSSRYPKGDDAWVYQALRADAERVLKRKEIQDAASLARAMELLFDDAHTADDFTHNVRMMLLAVQLVQMSRADDSE